MSTKTTTEAKWTVGQDVVLLDHGIGGGRDAYRCKITKVNMREFVIDHHSQKFRLRDGYRVGSYYAHSSARVEPYDEKHQPLLEVTRARALLASLRYRDGASAEQLVAALPHLEAAWRALGGKS